ncbi:MAG: class I SAM-dependent methyltransferase [bacterium]
MNFKDHFSKQAVDYAKYRPTYPLALFDYLASLTAEHELAWDCATGNGQAAVALAKYYNTVAATDASTSQIQNAVVHPKIQYRVSPAEKTNLKVHSVDLITVAQALHWFELDKFYDEVRRVSKSGGILAVWCYNLLTVDRQIDRLLLDFYQNMVGDFWPAERKLLEDEYAPLPFPFREIQPPPFKMTCHWNLGELVGYLNTWSAVQKYKIAHKTDPLDLITERLENLWGLKEAKKKITWPVCLRIGQVD